MIKAISRVGYFLAVAVLLSGLALAPWALAQRTGQDPLDPNALARFKNALDRDGFDVTPGAAVFENIVEEWCAGTIDNALYANNEPYIQVLVPESAWT
jgi:hypothetical protein